MSTNKTRILCVQNMTIKKTPIILRCIYFFILLNVSLDHPAYMFCIICTICLFNIIPFWRRILSENVSQLLWNQNVWRGVENAEGAINTRCFFPYHDLIKGIFFNNYYRLHMLKYGNAKCIYRKAHNLSPGILYTFLLYCAWNYKTLDLFSQPLLTCETFISLMAYLLMQYKNNLSMEM